MTTNTCFFPQFSIEFNEKLKICSNNEIVQWICRCLTKGMSMLEISKSCINQFDLIENYLEATDIAFFEAFISYKEKKYFDKEEAFYLNSRAGIIGQHYDAKNKKMWFFTTKDLIKELDGNEFFIWLNKTASNYKLDDEDSDDEEFSNWLNNY